MEKNIKDDVIIFKINNQSKIKIIKIANQERRSLSDFMRITIEDKIKENEKKGKN